MFLLILTGDLKTHDWKYEAQVTLVQAGKTYVF